MAKGKKAADNVIGNCKREELARKVQVATLAVYGLELFVEEKLLLGITEILSDVRRELEPVA